MFKLDLEKVEEQEKQIANINWIIEEARNSRKKINTSISALLICLKLPLDYNKLWKNFGDGNGCIATCPPP